jgi:hypothetical protein
VATRPYLPANRLAHRTYAQYASTHLVDLALIFRRRTVTSLRLRRRNLAAHTTNNNSFFNTTCTASYYKTSTRMLVSCILLNTKVSHKTSSTTAPY